MRPGWANGSLPGSTPLKPRPSLNGAPWQITDAYLLGLALSQGMVLVTFDKAILHLAGEYSHRVRVLGIGLHRYILVIG